MILSTMMFVFFMNFLLLPIFSLIKGLAFIQKKKHFVLNQWLSWWFILFLFYLI